MSTTTKLIAADGADAAECRAVAAARRAARESAARGRYAVGRWTVEVEEREVYTDGRPVPADCRWSVTVWYGTYDGQRSFTGPTREAAESQAAAYLAPAEVRLDPLDVGFDLRVTRTPVVLPRSGEITLVGPRSHRHPEGRRVGPLTAGWAASQLREWGFVVAGDGPPPPAPGVDANGAMIED